MQICAKRMHIESNQCFKVLRGKSGDRDVLIGFAPASVLCAASFVDVLDEATGEGYQRRFNRRHSLDFRSYIQSPGATTIPLTFNLRPEKSDYWEVVEDQFGGFVLAISDISQNVLSQVDCQHRLGFMEEGDTQLPFMVYLGLSAREEMSVFNTINAKSKGLSRSLTDFHDAQLIENVEREKPELVVAIRLNKDLDSPWHTLLDIGGKQVSGMRRRASLRTMQKAVRRFIKETQSIEFGSTDELYLVIRDFWCAITVLLEAQWKNPRKHFITKGIGVYALMSIAADLCKESVNTRGQLPSEGYYFTHMETFIPMLDWSSTGPLRGLGGEAGVSEALRIIRKNKFSAVGT